MRIKGKQHDPQKPAAEQQKEQEDADEHDDEQDDGSEDDSTISSSSSSSSSGSNSSEAKQSTNGKPEPTVEPPQPQAPVAQAMKANPQPQAPEPQPMKANPQPQAPEPQPKAQASTKQDVPNMSDPWILEALCLDPRVVILTEAKQASPHDCPST